LNIETLAVLPPGTFRSFAGQQSGIEIVQVFQHVGSCIFFHAPQGFHDAVLQALPDNARVRVG